MEPAPGIPKEPLGKRLLRGFLLLIALAALALFLLLLTPPVLFLSRWVNSELRLEEARGRIIDATTGAGVPGATVVVNSFRGMWTPSLVGSVSHGVAMTDAEGRFVVRYQRLGSTRISARAAGYATIFQVPLAAQDILLPTSPASPGEVIHREESGFDLVDSTSQVFFGLARDSVLADSSAADLAFAVDRAAPGQVIVRALGRGGLAADTPRWARDAIDPLAARCLAPDSGYVAADTVRGNVSTTHYFARSQDGNRFSRIKVRTYGRGPTPKEGYRVEVELWLNPTGGRNVCAVPVRNERYEFIAADRAAR
jgi:hypothetical protein